MAASLEPVFIIDANLPLKVPVWDSTRFLHVLKINPEWNDTEIWNYAKQKQLVIVSKDKDFSLLQIKEGSPPKLVHIKFGNFKFNLFIERIEAVWQQVEILLEQHATVNIYSDKIEAIK